GAWLVAAGLACAAAAAAAWYWLVPPPDAKAANALAPEAKRKELGKNLFLETEGEGPSARRRLVLIAARCLREGPVEALLTRQTTKEHESPLAVDTDAKLIHAALLAAGARPGTPVSFEPKYTPASGSTIKITLRYEKEGKPVTVPAQEWV